MKIITVIGARPQFIKAATVSRAMSQLEDSISEILIHTGQHYDPNMSSIFFEQMGIKRPDYHFGVADLHHGAMTGRMMEQVEEVLLEEHPDRVLVYGDTNSTLAGALAASKLHIPVAHVEAGLRSFNMRMPEEINRILTDRISDLLYCPTEKAVQNLQMEGYDSFNCRIIQAGDVMQDAALFYAERASRPSCLTDNFSGENFALVTMHRAENTDDLGILKQIVEALNEIHTQNMRILLPLHPRTKNKIEKAGLHLECDVLEPVGYLEMLYLIKHASIVLTDSGGLQKEAFFFAKPCVTMRKETEWNELVEHGFNMLAGNNFNSILEAFEIMRHQKVDLSINLFGSGNASSIIAQHLLTAFQS